jgi:hypothetical protein
MVHKTKINVLKLHAKARDCRIIYLRWKKKSDNLPCQTQLKHSVPRRPSSNVSFHASDDETDPQHMMGLKLDCDVIVVVVGIKIGPEIY